MKRAWQDDPDVVAEIEDAMHVATAVDFDDECFERNAWEPHGDHDSVGAENEEDIVMDAAFVKENFDRLYVQKVVRWVEEGRNVFVTGSQGRGKSTCMKRVISNLYRKGYALLVTGSTGSSVVNISDVAQEELEQAVASDLWPLEMASVLAPATVHSAFGLKYRENSGIKELRRAVGKAEGEARDNQKAGDGEHKTTRNVSRLVDGFMEDYVKRHQKLRDSFEDRGRKLGWTGVPSIAYADVVIIDEISMMDDILVEILDRVARYWRSSRANRPFGGLLIIFVGDFQQLPPVGSGTRQNPIYLFENDKWKTTTSRQGWVDRVLHLNVNIRQEGDVEYGRLLDRMAMNCLTSEDEDILSRCVLRPADGVSGLEVALNPYVMPGVLRVFNSLKLINRYTRAVTSYIDPDKKVRLETRQEYEPDQELIYEAYGRHEVQAKVEEFIRNLTKNTDGDFYMGCPIRILENKNVEEGIVNGASGKLVGLTEHGKHPIIELNNGKQITLMPSVTEIILDDYSNEERRKIKRGNLSAHPNRPLAKCTVIYYAITLALAMTPYGLQGCTTQCAIVHPNIDATNEFTTIECLFTALSRLCSSGLQSPGKAETLLAIPQQSLHPEPSDDSARPVGLYLTRMATYPFYVRPKVRRYIDNIAAHHSPI